MQLPGAAFINTRMSLGARLALLSGVFCVAIALLLTLFVRESLKQSTATKQEQAGTAYAAAIWPSIARAAGVEAPADPQAMAAARKTFEAAFGPVHEADAFAAAASPAAKLEAGDKLMVAVADASGLTLDVDLDSFYVMLPVTKGLPEIVQASADVRAAAAMPTSDPERPLRVAAALQGVRTASDGIGEQLEAAMKANASGDTRRALAGKLASLKQAVDALEAHRTPLMAGAGAETVAADDAALNTAADAAWRASCAELDRLLKVRASGLMNTLLTNLALVAAALVAAAALGLTIARGLSGRISDLLSAMDRLIGGDVAGETPHLSDRNETGRIAGTVEAFKQSLIEGARMRGEVAAQEARAEGERKAAEAERERAAAEQAQVVAQVAGGLEKLSVGVLTFRLTKAFPGSYEKLRADFNAAMDGLQAAMSTVASNTSGVRTASTEISQASDNLSRRTEQQAASLEETAAALDEITATVRKTADGAKVARDAMSAARSDAERSGVVVRDAVAAMSEIESSSQQISQIIGVIDEIAFQTNLLALNAGVEAARAGDAGRGFAVVASEVRALAQRSADAAKEIKALISASSQQVERGVSLVGETGKVLEQIVTQVTQINGVVTEIAASAEEQATGLQQVNTAVNQMDQVTQQNAAMVEEATAACHALTGEANMLSQLIEKFELDTGGSGERRAA